MSDPVTALGGQSFEGRVRVADAGLQGMIALRVDTDDAGAIASLRAAGFEMPSVGKAAGHLSSGALWMSPDEVLLLCDYATVDDTLERVASHLEAFHVLVTDVSDARCVVEVSGSGAAVREVLSKLTPADMRASTFPIGTLRRTRLAQVPAAIWFEEDGAAVVVAFRSVADYVFSLLSNAAKDEEVGYF